ncbi:DNA replication and repair protein RecF [Dyadobacter chenwenxiniae]|uniref:DNA replication and repair protein RecF n=1 Tax=Dyadobacter chenwenxiniae TaxID=2906456 RepID=A0A9X1PM82_9BACT|nr:DNA replication and repair protein RecF [Dyadobacter chenwenxiniae]MCF0062133.1 DNA replication and repair protein RecF [Dyadobacter chenwenxiniae]UON81937.1 DNA replication and repair protein RecF [Dyadobacter chenwenxiniae]
MWLEKLHLTYFKSYEEKAFTFGQHVNCLVGENGSGKTNLLDAIYFLSLTKSAFHNQDALGIRHTADFFVLDGIFNNSEKHTQITCSMQRGQRKIFMADKKNYDRLSDHIGLFPLVLIAPNDTDLIREGSEERRRFFDGVLAQAAPGYLTDFLQYNKILSQRNGLLKLFAERNYVDEDLLETYNEPLIILSQRIHSHRSAFMNRFVPLFYKNYDFLSSGHEQVDVVYESEVASENFPAEFRKNRARDLHAQRTGKGVHKDEYTFEIDGVTLKKFGSQGQQKSFLIALKLAQFELLKEEKEKTPILLLDDIFDKLDDRRIQKLIELIDTGFLGQVFITDARPERSQKILENVKADVRFFEIEKVLPGKD